MFTLDNTTGYTAEQLAELNDELAERLAGLEQGTYEYYQAEKAFQNEVAGR